MQVDQSNSLESDTPLFSIFWIFLKLGCTSFGGPIAHIGYFRHEFVAKRKWLDDNSYADLIALCNFLPGPASSQVGIALGISKGGLRGGLAAWLGFTMPSALALIAFAYAFTEFGITADAGWLHGLKIVAVAVIAQAIWGMGKTLCPDRFRATLAIIAVLIVFLWPTAWGQILAILMGGWAGWRYLEAIPLNHPENSMFRVTKRAAFVAWGLVCGLLIAFPERA